ncbi:beta-ketoacyl synthase N-terminal-like domain-containing protein [Flavobacterium silvaticum]|uniref:3-oxoacyl-ACP synthase n=1 Tax=Flavobacterium silvaticum TaxID=1852020 RepID=A0A972FM15_9FLAO|nr:beta-ketoacyl synthase N-terminal-like domain-containing protein [Flavobacterium silvaticum]NMH27700.1 3-oxoacyl-ACP synthase [Flavobacterium silvaticum]
MGKTFINGIGCVSAQDTVNGFPSEFIIDPSTNYLEIVKPDYKDYFSPIASRRMAKGVKNGIVASTVAMKEAGNESPDAIITGTGMGCIEDSDKFLKAIIDNKEEFLTPTSFIQSTHNTVASTIAINLGCKAYNFTYVNGAVSFESALYDAKLQLDADEAHSVLIGGVEEMTEYTKSLFKLAGFIKPDDSGPHNILEADTKATVFSEGATFFMLEDERKDSTYAEILDVEIVNKLTPEEAAEHAEAFIRRNNLTLHEIDAVVLGYNGDSEFDGYFKAVAKNFDFAPQMYYKHVSGEYNTASAFGLYVGANILKSQQIPSDLKANDESRPAYRNMLLYNQYRGLDHSFTLISV